MILSEVLEYGSKILLNAGLEAPLLDSKILIKNQLGLTDEDLIKDLNLEISNDVFKNFRNKIYRRESLEPIAHIIGKKDFWKSSFFVSKNSLIPRPDSETLIESLLKYISSKKEKLNFLDLGTGSGCLIISALQEFQNSTGKGIDISEDSISVANSNKNLIVNKSRLSFEVNDFCNLDTSSYDIIISNPPYVCIKEKNIMSEEVVRYEPSLALFPPNYSEYFYEKIINNVQKTNNKECMLFLEIDYRKADIISNLLKNKGFQVLGIENDLTHRPRCIVAKKFK